MATEWNPFADLRTQVETRRRPVRTSTSQAAGLYLPVAAPYLGTSGVIIGKEIHSGRGFIYDPFRMYGSGLPSPHVLVCGKSGRGKSALVKCYVCRQLAFRDRQFVVLDAQGDGGVGEWDAIARALGYEPIRIDPGRPGGVCINPLDPQIPAARQLPLLESLIELGGGSTVTRDERFALQAAHQAAANRANSENRVPVLGDVLAALTDPPTAHLGSRECTREELLSWGQGPAFVLQRLHTGPLAGAFDGPTSAAIDLSAPLIVFDLSALHSESEALPILMAIVGVWLRYSWIRPGDGIKRTLICEEAWHIIGQRSVARLFRDFLKYGRRLGLSFWAICHHLTDLTNSAAAGEAEAILKMTDTRVIYGLDSADADATAAVLKLPLWASATIKSPSLVRGFAVWSVAGRTLVVQHLATSTERPLVYTDRAMHDDEDAA
jgi:type IV secretory pathway VirB4 component